MSETIERRTSIEYTNRENLLCSFHIPARSEPSLCSEWGEGRGGGEDATSFIVLYGNELDQKIRKRFLLVTRMRSSRNEFLGIRDDPSVFVKKKVRKEASIDEYNNEIRSNSNIKILLSSETSCSTYLGGEYPPSERANVFLSSSA